jgi:hypothetical protein
VLTKEKLIEILHHGQKYIRHDCWCDEAALSFFLGNCPTRTLRGWRQQKKGPPAYRAERWLYDLDEVVSWFNSQRENNGGESGETGEIRKT